MFRRTPYYVLLLVASLFALTVFWSSHTGRHVDDPGSYSGFPDTKVLAHAPGYTVFENAYWQDGKVKIFTEDPWAVPSTTDIARHEADDFKSEFQDSEVYHVLDKRWILWDNYINPHFPVIEIERMRKLAKTAIVVNGSTFATADRHVLAHYYHFMEMFFPMWRVVAKARSRHPDIYLNTTLSNVAFFNAESQLKDWPQGGPEVHWKDKAGVNKVLLETAFPGLSITSRDDWDPRRQSGRLYRFPLLLLASRRSGHGGANGFAKPFGDILFWPVEATGWWEEMRQRLLSDHECQYPPPKASKPVVTYLSRQGTGRRLTDDAHGRLVDELELLGSTGAVEFRLEEFEDLPIPEQWARISRTTILVGVHGNGLTHLVMMPGLPGSAVYELQPRNCHNDYSPLASLLNIPHWIVQNDRMCAPAECKNRGCYEGDEINSDNIDVDERMLGNHIRQRLGIPPI